MNLSGRYLVTGGSGFLGRALIKRLVERGVTRIVALGRNESSLTALRDAHPSVEIVTGDIADPCAVQRALPNWAGIDGAVEYGVRAALGAAFSKTALDAAEQEWLFAWRSMQTQMSLNPVTVKLGSLEAFAELRDRDTFLT